MRRSDQNRPWQGLLEAVDAFVHQFFSSLVILIDVGDRRTTFFRLTNGCKALLLVILHHPYY